MFRLGLTRRAIPTLRSYQPTVATRWRSSRYRRFGEDPEVIEYEIGPDGGYRERRKRYNRGDWRGLLKNRNFQYFAAASGVFIVANLHQAPYTKRLQFLWVPYWLEEKIGDYSYRQILSEFQGQIADPRDPVYRPIREVMDRLLKAALDSTADPKQKEHLQKLDWKIHVVVGDQPPNAFILPNGKIFIFASILPICRDQDGLATVLSHELSHQLAHHSSEQISKSPIYLAISSFLFSVTGSTDLNNLLIQTLLQLPGSRRQETEADHIGCELLALACFNINSAVSFWQRMEDYEQQMGGAGGSGRMQEFFSTHPASQRRVNDIESWLPGLRQIQEEKGCHDQMNQFQGFKSFFNRA
ncbi:mitochondrial metalloendopeptidase Oma1p [Diutina catenulata]